QRVVVEADLRLIPQAVPALAVAVEGGVELIEGGTAGVQHRDVEGGVGEGWVGPSRREADLGEEEGVRRRVIQAAWVALGERVLEQGGEGDVRDQWRAAHSGLPRGDVDRLPDGLGTAGEASVAAHAQALVGRGDRDAVQVV